MKTRVISGVAIFLICVLPIVFGGIPLKILLAAILLIADYELINVRYHKPVIHLYFFNAVAIAFMALSDHGVMIGLLSLLLLFLLAVIDLNITVEDVALYFTTNTLIGFALKGIFYTYELTGNWFNFVYILLAVCLCDIFALLGGSRFGKHKLAPTISKNKTIEGSVCGWLFGAALSFVYALTVSKVLGITINVGAYLFISVTITILAQVGDLAFSMIKRHFDTKDFGNLIPGHGGVLDRIDSIIFGCIYFFVIMSFIL